MPSYEAKQRLLKLTTNIDEFYMNGNEVYWLCRKTIHLSIIHWY